MQNSMFLGNGPTGKAICEIRDVLLRSTCCQLEVGVKRSLLSSSGLSFREEAVPRVFGQGHERPDVHVRQW
jgi:hypothetical protein